MRRVGVHEAKTTLSKLLRFVEAGEEVEIVRGHEVVARLVPAPRQARRVLGGDVGRLSVPDDFDEPLPEDVLQAFE